MTEEEWLTGRVPERLAGHIWSRRPATPGNARRLRLLCCACARAITPLLRQSGSLDVLDCVERYADRKASRDDLWIARRAAMKLFEPERQWGVSPHWFAAKAVEELTVSNYNGGTHPSFSHAIRSAATAWAMERVRSDASLDQTAEFEARQAVHAHWLRDIFGNPFRPVEFSLAWHTDTVVSLARAMYDSRDFSAMPILADALQDAGCDNDDVLNHCRDTNPTHVRGCWVVDLALGKEQLSPP